MHDNVSHDETGTRLTIPAIPLGLLSLVPLKLR